MTIWHEDRLLIDGRLVPAETGATYLTVSPSTERVLGTAADATAEDARRAVAAARRAFVSGGLWSAPDAPFGGYKRSVVSREMGAAGLDEFLERKTLAEPAG